MIDIIKKALENMDKKFVKLSKIGIDENNPIIKRKLEKYQERPFAYEFYHQLRKLIDEKKVNLGGYIIQPEVNKSYQPYFEKEKIPDFIFHIPDANKNLLVMEFKRTEYISSISDDFEKLIDFKTNPAFKSPYLYAVEVVIGDTNSLANACKTITTLSTSEGIEIMIIYFDTQKWEAEEIPLQFNIESLR